MRLFGCLMLLAITGGVVAASEHRGQVKLGSVPIPGVAVTATQGDKVVSAITDDQGAYTFPDLPDGEWTVEIAMSGFAKQKQVIAVGPQTAATAWELKMLPMSEIGAVTAPPAPPAAATAPAAGSNARPAANGGSGAANNARPQTGFQRTDLNANRGPAAPAANDAPALPNESVADLTQRAADGLLINGSVNNGAASPFAQASAFGNNRRTRALYNGAFGVNVNNSVFDARSYSLTGQNSEKPSYNQGVALFSIGGPVRIPHLVRNGPTFFFSYQRTQNRNVNNQSGLMPTAAERAGDLSGFATPLIDPESGVAFPGNVIPPDRISPQARALLGLYPLPNSVSLARGYNYQVPLVAATHQDLVMGRLSKTLPPRSTIGGDITLTRAATDNPNLFGLLGTSRQLNINGAVNYSRRFGQRFSTTVRYQFGRTRTRVMPFFANRRNVSGDAGINGNNQDPLYWGAPTLTFAGGAAALTDSSPAFTRNQNHTFTSSSVWNRSPHSFTFGGDFRRQQLNLLTQQDARGTFTFTGGTTGSDFADFLLGIPATSSIAFGNADKYFRGSVYDLFITDDWRARTGLTLTLGVRWEYETPLNERYGRLVNLDIAPGFSSAQPIFGQTLRADGKALQPRLGLAWRPLPASSLVVRASYGVYRNTNVYQSIVTQMAQQPPLSKTSSVQNTPAAPLTLADGFNATPATTPNTFAVDPDFKIGYAQTWNVSVQRDLPMSLQMTATYTGTKGSRLMQEVLPNTYPSISLNPCPACPTGFAYLTSNGNSTRHAGQIQLRRRLHNGFTANLGYTLAKALDDAGFTGPNSLIAQNWLDLRSERALSSFDQRHQVVAQGQYTTGMGVGGGMLMRGWRGSLFREWTLAAQLTAGSGLPLTPVLPSPVGRTAFTGSIRPDYNGGARLSAASYSAPLEGRWGNAGRNSVTGPSQFGLNASLSRTLRTGDRINTDIRVDATNVLNHVTYPSWNTTVTSAQFGQPFTANAMRKIQTTLRMRF
jgi:hypothetical protein